MRVAFAGVGSDQRAAIIQPAASRRKVSVRITFLSGESVQWFTCAMVAFVGVTLGNSFNQSGCTPNYIEVAGPDAVSDAKNIMFCFPLPDLSMVCSLVPAVDGCIL